MSTNGDIEERHSNATPRAPHMAPRRTYDAPRALPEWRHVTDGWRQDGRAAIRSPVTDGVHLRQGNRMERSSRRRPGRQLCQEKIICHQKKNYFFFLMCHSVLLSPPSLPTICLVITPCKEANVLPCHILYSRHVRSPPSFITIELGSSLCLASKLL
jgi:hypothetical protein